MNYSSRYSDYMDLQKKKKKAEALRLQRAKDEEAAKLAAEAASPPGSGLHDALIEPTPTPGRPGDYNTGSGLHDALVNQNPAGPVDTAPPPVIDQAAAQGAAAPPPVVDQAAAQSAAAPPPVVNQAAAQGAAAPPPVVNQAAAQAEAAPPPVINQAAAQGAAGAGTTPPVVDQAAAQGSGGAMSGASLTDAITEPVVNQAAAQAAAAPPPVVDPAPVVNQAAAQGAAGPPVDQANAQAAAGQQPPVAAQTNPTETAPPAPAPSPAVSAPPAASPDAGVLINALGQTVNEASSATDTGAPVVNELGQTAGTDTSATEGTTTAGPGVEAYENNNVFNTETTTAAPQFSMDDVTRMVNEQLGNWQTDFMNQFNTGRDEWRTGVESGLADQRQTWQDQFTAERDKALQDWGLGRDASRDAWRTDALSGLQGDMSDWQDQFGRQYQADRSLDQMGRDEWRAGALGGIRNDMIGWQDQFSRDYQTDRDLDQLQRDQWRSGALGGLQQDLADWQGQFEAGNQADRDQWRQGVEAGLGDWRTGFEGDQTDWQQGFGDKQGLLLKQLGLDQDKKFSDFETSLHHSLQADRDDWRSQFETGRDDWRSEFEQGQNQWGEDFRGEMQNYFNQMMDDRASSASVSPQTTADQPATADQPIDQAAAQWAAEQGLDGKPAAKTASDEGGGRKKIPITNPLGQEIGWAFATEEEIENDEKFRLAATTNEQRRIQNNNEVWDELSEIEGLSEEDKMLLWEAMTDQAGARGRYNMENRMEGYTSPDFGTEGWEYGSPAMGGDWDEEQMANFESENVRPDTLKDMPEITDYSDVLNEPYLNQVLGRLEAPSAYDERMEQITSGKESVVNKKWDDAIDRFMSNAGVQDDFGSPKFQATLAEMESNRARELGQIHSDWGMEAAGADEDMHRGRIGDLGYALQGERGRVADELARYGAAVSGADQQYRDWLSDTSAAYYQPYLWGDQGLGMMLGGIGSTMNPIAGVGAAMGGLSNVAAAGGAQAGRDMQNWGNLFNAISPAISNWWGSRNNTGSVNSGYGGGGGIVPL